MSGLLILIIVFLIIFNKKKTKKSNIDDKTNQINYPEYYNQEIEDALAEIDKEIEKINYIKNAYRSKWMFTMNEKPAYFKLKEIADKHNLILFAKVRLLDLVSPVNGHQKYKTNLYRIQAKHVDFVLCKNNLVAKYVIELDDSSHDTQKGKARDQFVDNVLTSCGYKVLHTRSINEEEIEKFISQ